MKTCSLFLVLAVCCIIATVKAAPVDSKNALDQSKSAFGQPFDEIVVESSLIVRRKDPGRQARNKPLEKIEVLRVEPAKVESVKREKRQGRQRQGNRPNQQRPNGPVQNNFGSFPAFPAFPSGGAAQAGAQAQDFNANGPLGSFGASATGTQTQTLGFGPGGIAGAGGFSMTQQYRLPNGQVVDFTINNSFGGTQGASAQGGGSSLTISKPARIAVGK